MFLALCVAVVAGPAWAVPSAAVDDDWITEGLQYELITTPVPTRVQPGMVEVVEMFWYGCPHCYRFEPYVTKWLSAKPASAEFRRVPSVLNPGWAAHARTYYALELMGETERFHPLLFQAIHDQHRRLLDERSITRFLVQQGIDEERFQEAYHSLPVQTRVRDAEFLGQGYGINGVPAVIVNGKYRTSASQAGGYDKMLDVINYLVAKESVGPDAPVSRPAPATP